MYDGWKGAFPKCGETCVCARISVTSDRRARKGASVPRMCIDRRRERSSAGIRRVETKSLFGRRVCPDVASKPRKKSGRRGGGRNKTPSPPPPPSLGGGEGRRRRKRSQITGARFEHVAAEFAHALGSHGVIRTRFLVRVNPGSLRVWAASLRRSRGQWRV